MDGFYIVDKPAGITCQTVCNKIKHNYKFNKVGHNGTLDPETTGVMVVACNRATKMLQYLINDSKTYLTTIVFGYLTNTLDAYGEKIAENRVEIEAKQVDLALKTLLTRKEQIPPMVSAIKINGRKLYDYERKNIEVELSPRPVEIYDIKIVKPLYNDGNFQKIDLILDVSKGFYVRSFARDLGELVGTYAVMGKLERLRAGRFEKKDAIPLSTILEKNITPIAIEDVFNYPKININERILRFVENGVTLYNHNLLNDCKYRDVEKLDRFILIYLGKNIAIYERKGEIYRPIFIY